MNSLGMFLLALKGKKITKGMWSREREDLPHVVNDKRVPWWTNGWIWVWSA